MKQKVSTTLEIYFFLSSKKKKLTPHLFRLGFLFLCAGLDFFFDDFTALRIADFGGF